MYKCYVVRLRKAPPTSAADWWETHEIHVQRKSLEIGMFDPSQPLFLKNGKR